MNTSRLQNLSMIQFIYLILSNVKFYKAYYVHRGKNTYFLLLTAKYASDAVSNIVHNV